ncbi:alpha-L-fucosidase [Bacillus sp. FJAT-28004]|uniref:alpha-L-fucosidase n=1 Tax=Bacillus sp. FJAT-28004 TaxID=1679165 RepID=UPI0006B4396D|nr:alpha-L-fucosidase [Bacillus sp. FJAT-28004]
MSLNFPIPSQHVSRFERLGFGMFIHWGLYSQLGQGEWAMHLNRIPKEEYSKLQDTFTVEEFDARAIAKLARKAGMKYITLTTRHHDGFSLYDTRGLNDYDAPHSAAKRDLIAEFVEGCRAEGIIPFFYHTTLDWYQDSFNGDFDAYLNYLQQSVEILCKNYGEIGGLWFDGNWSRKGEDWKEDALYGMIRRYQPNAMIINNTGLSNQGELGHPELDSVTFEQVCPAPLNREGMSKYVTTEMCQTINGHWGYGRSDFNVKSPKELIETLCASRKVGSNYLLNIGPTGSGAIPKLQSAILETIGEWVDVFGEAIYDGMPCGIAGSGDDFALETSAERTFLFIYHLKIDGHANVTVGNSGIGPRVFQGLKQPIQSIVWLDNREELSFVQNLEEGVLCLQATGYPYGVDYVVRVAEVLY